jgi:hypothetical protein
LPAASGVPLDVAFAQQYNAVPPGPGTPALQFSVVLVAPGASGPVQAKPWELAMQPATARFGIHVVGPLDETQQ